MTKAGKTVNCCVCEKEFYINPSRLKNNYHTCSTVCRGKKASLVHSQKIKTNCTVCNKEVFYKQSHFKQIKHHSCSRACSSILRGQTVKGTNNPRSLKLNETEKIFWNRASDCRYRAKAKKLDYNIDYKFLEEMYSNQNGLCFYTKMPMKLKGSLKDNNDCFSVDRIDSTKGYTKDNVVLCLNIINRFKGDSEMVYFKNIFQAIFNVQKQSFNSRVKLLSPTAKAPVQGRPFDSGYDLFVDRIEETTTTVKVYTGIAIQPDFTHWFMLVPRSSTYKKGLMLYNSCGIIDCTYSGEIMAIFHKTEDFKELPKVGERLLQIIPQERWEVEFEEVPELDETNRGTNGYGSSGK